jgi:hypothetical protein
MELWSIGAQVEKFWAVAAEFRFRYNSRENDDIFGTAVSGC